MQNSILITGCSSGIGLCAAQTLHKRGYRVFATARKEQDVQKLLALGIESLILDINDSESIKTAVAQILAKTNGTLDALFNNSGYAVPGAIEDLTRDMLRAQFETNVFGPMELINLVLPVMRKQGHGRIIQNSSMLGIITMPYRGAYNASKFAVEGFTNTLRQELKDTNIKVSTIVPGPIKSAFRTNACKSYELTLKDKQSIHALAYQNMEKTFTQPPPKLESLMTKGPEAVVNKLISALESQNPSAHYYVTIPAHVFNYLRRVLPDNLLDWVINKISREEIKR